ncbi:helix-turn-helix transcriptional regulator, partial [Arthrospira platensis SPKY1]|nr:helix-turn-helix transcriptional regulator [Arthrospira platensis SPKY1]
MTSLGDTIRELMELRRLSGVKLAAGVGVSPTSISKILNNQSKPRQITLTRIIRELCLTPQEEQRVIRAFSGLPDAVPDEPGQPP